MTIAISIKVNDGVVLASDSATSIMGPDEQGELEVINVYNHANKVFSLYRGLPIGGITWDAGSIGHASISTLAKDLRRRFMGTNRDFGGWEIDKDDYTVKEVAERTREFLFEEHYRRHYGKVPQAEKPSLGFLVAGYSAGTDLAEEWLVEIDNGKCKPPTLARQQTKFGWLAYASWEPIQRLLWGYSPAMSAILEQCGADPKEVANVMKYARAMLEEAVVIPAMPIQDAIDFAEFLVDLSCKYYRFKLGPDVVGGPPEIAAITKHEGFKWIKRKHYFESRLNPYTMELDHAPDLLQRKKTSAVVAKRKEAAPAEKARPKISSHQSARDSGPGNVRR